MNKHYISTQQLLEDSFALAMQVFESGYRPDYIVGVWRGGAPVAIAVHELLETLGVKSDHIAIRTSSYSGIDQRSSTVEVDGLGYIVDRISGGGSLLLVDDVHDTGLSLDQVITELEAATGNSDLDIRIATPYYKRDNNRSGRVPDYFIHESKQWLVFPHELNGLGLDEIRQHKPELAKYMDKLELLLKTDL